MSRMKIFMIILHLIKMVLRALTGYYAVIFFVSFITSKLLFAPVDFADALEKMQIFSVGEIVGLFFDNYWSLIVPMGLVASITFIPFMVRIAFSGFSTVVQDAIESPNYVLIWSDGTREHRNDGCAILFGGFIVRAALLVIAMPLMLVILPLGLIIDAVMLVLSVVSIFTEGL